MKRSRTSLLAALASAGLLILSACASSPAAESSTSTPLSTEGSADTAAVTTATVSCEEFNAISTVDEAFAAMGSVTSNTFTDANDHSLLQGAQNACMLDSSRTLNEVMTELTEGQVIAAPSDGATNDADASSSNGSVGAGSVAEACSFGSEEPYFTVEILPDFPDVWKRDAPLPKPRSTDEPSVGGVGVMGAA